MNIPAAYRPTGWRIDQMWLASVVAVASVLLAGLEIVTFFSYPAPLVHPSMARFELWQYVLQGSSLVVAGFLVVARRGARVVGGMLLNAAFVFMIAACLSTWLRFANAPTAAVHVAVYAEYALWQVPRIVLALLPLFFPDGKLPGRWARPFGAALVVVILAHETAILVGQRVWHPGGLTLPNALFVPGWAAVERWAMPPLNALLWCGVLAATLSPLLRWRHAGRMMRRQLAIGVPTFTLVLVEEILRDVYYWSPVVVLSKLVTIVAWPAAIGYLILQDRLYELDRATRRIVASAVPIVLLAAVYAGAAATMSATLPGAGVALPAMLAVLAALVGLVLRPTGRWVLTHLDRLLYGDRAEPYKVARRLAGQLRGGVAPAEVPAIVCQIMVSALRFPGAALDATVTGQVRRLASVGDLDNARESVELRHQGQLVGWLVVSVRAGQSHLDDLDRAALQPLIDLAAPSVSAARLTQELAASRALIVSAQDDERRRLHRDVHDGLGPSLAAIRLRIETAVALMPAGSAGVALLADASHGLREIAAELRSITQNQRPPLLDQLGLPGALAELAGRLSSPALQVETAIPEPLPLLSPAVELVVYRVAAEALANVVRHASASRAAVRVTEKGTTVALSISDNGVGVRESAVANVGLRSMAERAAAAGGWLHVTSDRSGTTVVLRLPIGDDAEPIAPEEGARRAQPPSAAPPAAPPAPCGRGLG